MNTDVLETEATEVVEIQNQAITGDLLMQMDATLQKMKEGNKGMLLLQGEFFPFLKPGDKSEGVFIGYSDVQFKLKNGPRAGELGEIQTAAKWLTNEDGVRKIRMGAGAALVNELKKNNIQQGNAIVIEYKELGGKNNQTKIYNVYAVAV